MPMPPSPIRSCTRTNSGLGMPSGDSCPSNVAALISRLRSVRLLIVASEKHLSSGSVIFRSAHTTGVGTDN